MSKPKKSHHHHRTAATTQERRLKETLATRRLLAKAKDLLREVDESYVMHQTEPRQYPTFERSELAVGPLLGVGGFGIVYEISDIKLKKDDIPRQVELKTSSSHNTKTTPEPGEPSRENGNVVKEEKSPAAAAAAVSSAKPLPQSPVEVPAVSESLPKRSTISAEDESESQTTNNTDTVVAFEEEALASGDKILEVQHHHPSSSLLVNNDDHHHYNVRGARKFMAKHVRRSGDARYAIKRLHRDLSELERARGMIDLAIEAKFLSVMWHPNIIKMRGIATGPMLNPQFFIILDRLYETLAEKQKTWASDYAAARGGLFGMGAHKAELQQLLIERMIVAYDVAAAFTYMHENKIVYRDVKKENIGFDVRGDVKVFDFGLSKSLSPKLKARDNSGREVYGYNLTPRTGSIPFMAPEVAECRPYDEKCDVFSFAILLWEILALKCAFKGYSRREFLERVVRGKERHAIYRQWPPLTRLLLREAWDTDPQKRPDMKRVAALLRGDLNEMSTDSKVRDRTTHMRNRSQHSLRLARASSSQRGGGSMGSIHSK